MLYLFGDNLLEKGLGGQAKEMRGEPNAVGVPTKIKPTRGKDAYFSDEKFEEYSQAISRSLDPAIEQLKEGGLVVIPLDGLGTGLSQLPTRAPKLNAHLEYCLNELTQI